ncbi:hypothetical protein P8C59_004052 [Phyllachora maydis]|uniref:C2H2-type domain-containing protein n=1 Tax=Phyllachora maydis TaxID=1825666 RepID=A0AAD9I1L2_9PEZI|nr:hypothetical protein P8C59_004052 [Phyllachora maydis]
MAKRAQPAVLAVDALLPLTLLTSQERSDEHLMSRPGNQWLELDSYLQDIDLHLECNSANPLDDTAMSGADMAGVMADGSRFLQQLGRYGGHSADGSAAARNTASAHGAPIPESAPASPAYHHEPALLGAVSFQELSYSMAPPSSVAMPSSLNAHDDMCVDNCTGLGVYNGSTAFNHRGASMALRAHTSSYLPRHSISQAQPYTSQLQSQHLSPQPWMQQRAFAHLGLHHNHNTHMFDNHDFALHRTPISQPVVPPVMDDDVGSCCNSNCDMEDKCTGVSCADKADACTDRNCPGQPPSLDLDDAAATLMDLSHGQEQQEQQHALQTTLSPHDMCGDSGVPTGMGDALSFCGQPFFPDLAECTTTDCIMSLKSHIETSHHDPDRWNCMAECPLAEPSIYSRCVFPKDGSALFSGNMSVGFYDHFCNDHSVPPHFIPCGAEIKNPQDLVCHYFDAHQSQLDARHAFKSGDSTSNNEAYLTTTCTPRSRSSTANAFSPAPTPETTVTAPGNEHVCFWCEPGSEQQCGMGFNNTKELNEHVVNQHIKELTKKDHCYHCGWLDCQRPKTMKTPGFAQRSKLERHMQTHVGHKPFQCQKCNAEFSGKQALSQHLLAHDGQKPLSCPHCDKKFTYKSSLTMHLRTHSGEKPLECPICHKRFSESSNLSKHKRIHDQQGRYLCQAPGCLKRFNRLDQLRRHSKSKHHGAGLSTPPFEPAGTDQDGDLDVHKKETTQLSMPGLSTKAVARRLVLKKEEVDRSTALFFDPERSIPYQIILFSCP